MPLRLQFSGKLPLDPAQSGRKRDAFRLVGYPFITVESNYPLEVLRSLRATRADARARALAHEEQRLGAAQHQLAEAERAFASARERAAAMESAEQQRLSSGLERVEDLLRAADARRLRTEHIASLAAKRQVARRSCDEAQRNRARALAALGHARDELAVVERHRDAFEHEQARLAEQHEEDAALDRWNAQRFGPGGR